MVKRNDASIRQFFSDSFIASASYNRMKSYMYDHETIVLTADKSQRNKSDYTGEYTNEELEIALRDGLRELCAEYGWKVIPVYGGYQGVNDKSESNEHSYMVINMNDDPDFRQIINDFMREFDDTFNLEFKQECIIYSPALGHDSVRNGENRHKFFGEAEFDYPSIPDASPDNVGMFEDKARSVSRDDDGSVNGYFYTKPRRHKSHSYAFGDDFVDDKTTK